MSQIQTYANTPCSPTDIESFLAEAEDIAAKKGQRMTKIRRKVLRLLLENDGPSKAYDLLSKLDGEGAAKPPTIYRALDFLQEVGLAHKIESLNAYVACGHASHAHSAVFLICNQCEKVIEIHAIETIEALEDETERAGFSVTNAVVEARVDCHSKCE